MLEFSVFNLATGKRSPVVAATAEDAVRAAFAAANPGVALPPLLVGKVSVACGDFCAMFAY